MKAFVFLLALIVFESTSATENLAQNDFVGIWATTHQITKGEKTTLIVKPDLSSALIREFSESDSPRQEFTSKTLEFLGDLILIEFTQKGLALSYKIVLGGWKIKSDIRIFGTLFLYRNGQLFNGLPISFTKIPDEI